MRKLILLGTLSFISVFAIAKHHEQTQDFPFKYFLQNDIYTENPEMFVSTVADFVGSGVLDSRGVALGLYQYNAVGRFGASHVMMFSYPDADSLPSPTLLSSITNSCIFLSIFFVSPVVISIEKLFVKYVSRINNNPNFLNIIKPYLNYLKA